MAADVPRDLGDPRDGPPAARGACPLCPPTTEPTLPPGPHCLDPHTPTSSHAPGSWRAAALSRKPRPAESGGHCEMGRESPPTPHPSQGLPGGILPDSTRSAMTHCPCTGPGHSAVASALTDDDRPGTRGRGEGAAQAPGPAQAGDTSGPLGQRPASLSVTPNSLTSKQPAGPQSAASGPTRGRVQKGSQRPRFLQRCWPKTPRVTQANLALGREGH